jgi:hypothetical protein
MSTDSLHNAIILEDELMPLIRERLAAGQRVRYLPFRGYSMLPMLRQGIDTVELAPLPEKLSKYDLPVYQYPSGKYVMHRIVKVEKNHCICLGDNTYSYEVIRREQMLGIVSAFKRGTKRIEANAFSYRLYCRIWVAAFPARKFLKCAFGWIKRHIIGNKIG